MKCDGLGCGHGFGNVALKQRFDRRGASTVLTLPIDENFNHRILRGLLRAMPHLDHALASAVELKGGDRRRIRRCNDFLPHAFQHLSPLREQPQPLGSLERED